MTVEDSPKLLPMTNRKLLMRFRLAPRSMTLDDLEPLDVRILGEFRVILQILEATTSRLMKMATDL